MVKKKFHRHISHHVLLTLSHPKHRMKWKWIYFVWCMLRVRETERHGQKNIMHWKCNRNIVFMSSLLSNTPKLNVRCSRRKRSASKKKHKGYFIVYFYMYVRGAPLKIFYFFVDNIESREKLFCYCSFQTQRMEIFILLSNLSNMRRKKHTIFMSLWKLFLPYFSQNCK
jgi:hypothetical protein